MEKADIIIAVVGVTALVATTLGVVFYEEISGEVDIDFSSQEQALAESYTGQDVTTPSNFAFAAGNNATAASFDVTVNFAGQSVQGGTATIDVTVTDPTGNSTSRQCSMTIGSNVQSATADCNVELPTFFETPEHTHTSDFGSFDMSNMWDNGYTVRISVTPPSETLPVGSNYSFSADISGSETTFYHQLSSHNDDSVEAI